VVEGKVIDDSRKILKFVDQEFEGVVLFPTDEEHRTEVERWVEEAYQTPERVLAYGMGKLKSMGARTNRSRLKALRKWRNKTPDMRDIYDGKIADIESFLRDTHNADHVESAWTATRQRLDWADQHLRDRQFCCGDAYTAADVVWTVTVARQQMLGCAPFEGRPALQAWFLRMRARPSYAKADVWARFKPEVMLPVLLFKFKWHLLVGLTLATLITIGLLSCFNL
jgi:glutathione S-transferase